MKIEIVSLNNSYNFLKISNFLSSEELESVWDEITFLAYKSKHLSDPGSALDEFNKPIATSSGIWLDDIYKERSICNYFKYYKTWLSEDLKNHLEKAFYWRSFFICDDDSTLLRYYENNSFYKPHIDQARFTQLYWTFKEPKKFTGGQLIFDDFNYEIEIENNTMIVFPSWLFHQVKPVVLKEGTPDNKDKYNCNGRFVFSTFYR